MKRRAIKRLHCRARTVGGKVKDWRRTKEPAAPVLQLIRQSFAFYVFPMPNGEVGVLNLQLLERRFVAANEGFVERRQFPGEHSHRPAVADDVMYERHQRMVKRSGGEQSEPEERAAMQIEWDGSFPFSEHPNRSSSGVFPKTADIDYRYRRGLKRMDYLHGPAVTRLERRPERFVTSDDFSERLLQCRHRKQSAPPHSRNDVVNAPIGFKLIEKPEALLGVREHSRSPGDGSCYRRRNQVRLPANIVSNLSGQIGEDRVLEDFSQRDVDAKSPPHSRHHLRSQK